LPPMAMTVKQWEEALSRLLEALEQLRFFEAQHCRKTFLMAALAKNRFRSALANSTKSIRSNCC